MFRSESEMTSSRYCFRSCLSRYARALAVVFLALISFRQVPAQIITKDWAITEPNLDSLHWGAQEISVRVRNNSGAYKFFVATSATRSPMRRYSEIRTHQSNYIFVPDEEKDITFIVDVPENLSFVTSDVSFYDVVDTVDDLSFGKQIYDHTFKVTPPTPPGLRDYTSLAPRAGSILKFNKALKTDLSLLIHTMLQEPQSIETIATRLKLPVSVVTRTIRGLESYGFVRKADDDTYRSTLTPIEGLSPGEVNSLIDKYTARMSAAIEVALPKFLEKRQQMMDAGLVTKGSKQTLEGTGMLHHLFPVIGGITLWENVGSQFLIGGDGPPQVIDLDAPCDMAAEGYGYVLVDSSLHDGDDFYFYEAPLKRRVYGENVPAVLCTRRIPTATMKPSYYLPSKKTTLMYYYDTDRVADAVNIFRDPLVPMRESFRSDVDKLFDNSGVRLTAAHRYWLWNRLVTAIMTKLVNDGTLDDGRRTFYTWRERVKDGK